MSVCLNHFQSKKLKVFQSSYSCFLIGSLILFHINVCDSLNSALENHPSEFNITLGIGSNQSSFTTHSNFASLIFAKLSLEYTFSN